MRYDVADEAYWLEPHQAAAVRDDLPAARIIRAACVAGRCSYAGAYDPGPRGHGQPRKRADDGAGWCDGQRPWLHLGAGERPVIRYADCPRLVAWYQARRTHGPLGSRGPSPDELQSRVDRARKSRMDRTAGSWDE